MHLLGWEEEDFSSFTQEQSRSSLFCAPSSVCRTVQVSELAYSHSTLCSKDVQRYSTSKHENHFAWGKLNSLWYMRNRPTITHLHELSCCVYRYLNIVMRLTYIQLSHLSRFFPMQGPHVTSSEQGNCPSPILLTYFPRIAAQHLFSKMARQNTGKDHLLLNLSFPIIAVF